MSQGRYFYLSAATADAIASKGRADLLAGYMVLAANRQKTNREITTAGARAVGSVLGLGRTQRLDVVRELMQIPICRTSDQAATAVMETAALNSLAKTEYPDRWANYRTLALPVNVEDDPAEYGGAFIPQTIVKGLNGRTSPIALIMGLPRPRRLPALQLLVHFCRFLDPLRFPAFDPRYTAWEAPDQRGENGDKISSIGDEYWFKRKKHGLWYWVIPASSSRWLSQPLTARFGSEDVWQALQDLLEIGIIRRSLMVFDGDPTQQGDAELQYILYERNLSQGTADGLHGNTSRFFDWTGYEQFWSNLEFEPDTGFSNPLGSNAFVIVSDSRDATPIWVYRPVHDIGTLDGEQAAINLAEKHCEWQKTLDWLIDTHER